jgi:arylsulfatase A-like enzyme
LEANLTNETPVKMVFNLPNINSQTLPDDIKQPIVNGYNPQRSGDVQIVYQPAILEDRPQGATHGTLFNYDTHIPLLWYGWNVKAGYDYSQTYMTDIAATLAAILHIQEPNGCIGKPILIMNK